MAFLQIVIRVTGLSKALIRLDSVSDRIEYWKRQGYELTGTPSFIEKWGALYPMEKKLTGS